MRNFRWVLLAAAVLALVNLACGSGGATPTAEVQPTREMPTPEPIDTPAPEPTNTPAPEPTNTPVLEAEEDGAVLELINRSGGDIWYVYVSPSKADDWGEDWLGDDLIRDGDSYAIAGIPDGVYDISVEGKNNQPIEVVWEVDLRDEVSLTIVGLGSLEVVNESGVAIAYLYISPTASDTWDDEWLGGELIEEYGTYTVEGIPGGRYDIQARDEFDQEIETVFNVDLSGHTTWAPIGMAPLPDNAVLRFEDDFSDNRHDWGLDTEGEDVYYMRPSGGEYCILIKSDQLTAWEWYEPFRTDEFVAEVVCSISDAEDASCGLGFGPDGDNLYWFEVSPSDQTYALFLLENDTWQDALVEWTPSANVYPYGVNYLSMERVDGVVSLYVNGVLQDQIESLRFPSGRIGIGGATYTEGGARVCLDDLRVWHLE